MNIYVDGALVDSVKSFYAKKDTGFLVRIIGVNLTHENQKTRIAPVYLPVLTVELFAGGIFIQIPFRGQIHFFVIKGRSPYISHATTDINAEEIRL